MLQKLPALTEAVLALQLMSPWAELSAGAWLAEATPLTLSFCSLELALNTAQFAKSLAMLGSSEDNTALSRALSQLAEVEEKIEQLHQEQANNDFFLLAELLGDYIRLLSVVRVSTPLGQALGHAACPSTDLCLRCAKSQLVIWIQAHRARRTSGLSRQRANLPLVQLCVCWSS